MKPDPQHSPPPNRTGGSLRFRLLVFVFLPMLAAILALGLTILSHLEDEAELKMQEEVELIARALQSPLARALERNREGSVQGALLSAFSIGRVYSAHLYDDQGRLLAGAGEEDAGRESAPQLTANRIARIGQPLGEYSELGGRSVYSFFVPLHDSAENMIGLLQVTRRERDFREYMSRLRGRAALLLLLGTGALLGIVSFGYQRAFGRSLKGLRGSMARIEAGEHAHRAAPAGPREIAGLSRSLNAMLDSMSAARLEIEEQRAREDDLKRQLRHSEKLALLGQVAGGVAHELGTPLSLIDGRAQRSLRNPDLDPDARAMLTDVREQVRRMEKLLRQLLELGQPSGPQRKRIRADQLAERVAAQLAPIAEEHGTRLELGGPRPGPFIWVDPFRFELALGNLVQNAFQATPGGRVRLTWSAPPPHAGFCVTDDGPGIEPRLRERVFDPFFTTKNSPKRSGLGLAVVQQIAMEHGARVEVGDADEGGAAMRIILPDEADAQPGGRK